MAVQAGVCQSYIHYRHRDGAAVSHAESASLAQRHHSTYSGTLEAALQAEWCQITRHPTEERRNRVVQPQATGPLSG